MPKPTKIPATAKKKPAKAPATLNKFWEAGPTLHDFFDEYPELLKERLAMHDYLHGSTELLAKLVMEKTGPLLSQELALFLSKIIRGEKLRGKGRPRGSTQHDPLTRVRMYAQIVRWTTSGMPLEKAYAQIAAQANVTPRVIRQYYEEFKNPPPVKPPHTPAPTK
ncbi:MAG: hypothetical protein KGJ82_03605 [Nitrospirota bacterium]|nr:hypothetical protein [Nitrospirota bacterium]